MCVVLHDGQADHRLCKSMTYPKSFRASCTKVSSKYGVKNERAELVPLISSVNVPSPQSDPALGSFLYHRSRSKTTPGISYNIVPPNHDSQVDVYGQARHQRLCVLTQFQQPLTKFESPDPTYLSMRMTG